MDLNDMGGLENHLNEIKRERLFITMNLLKHMVVVISMEYMRDVNSEL